MKLFYCKIVDLLSFLGKEQSAVLTDEIRPLLDLYVHFERPQPRAQFFYLMYTLFNRLWAIDANWRHIHNVRYRRLTPNGVKAVFFVFFVHSARLLRSTSGLWLAADRRY